MTRRSRRWLLTPRWDGNHRGSIIMQEIAIDPGAARRHSRGVVLVAGSAAAWSIAGIITRLTATDAWTTLFWRSVFAAAFLGCFIAFRSRAIGGSWSSVSVGQASALL